MGSVWFDHVMAGKDSSEAFSSAVEDARHRYGNDGHTGSIAEKAGFQEFRPSAAGIPVADFLEALTDLSNGRDADVRSRTDARAWKYLLDAHETTDSKYGPAGCVRLPEEDRRAQRVLVDAPHGEHAYYFWGWARD